MVPTGVVLPLLAAALHASVLGEYPREDVPEGLSGITRRAADRYFGVDDSGGSVFEYRLKLDQKGEIAVCENLGSFKLAGRVDLEGCAWDPLAGRLWVSDEHDHSVRAFAPTGGCALAVLDLPKDVVGKFRRNRSLEALSISPDALTLWTANEDALEGDGPLSNRAKGGVVRLMRFTRPNGETPWRFDRFFRYETDPVAGEPFQGQAVSGVSALCACADGSLLVLEREFSAKQPFDATFRARLYRVSAASLSVPLHQLLALPRLRWPPEQSRPPARLTSRFSGATTPAPTTTRACASGRRSPMAARRSCSFPTATARPASIS